jgi:hypothetical protein
LAISGAGLPSADARYEHPKLLFAGESEPSHCLRDTGEFRIVVVMERNDGPGREGASPSAERGNGFLFFVRGVDKKEVDWGVAGLGTQLAGSCAQLEAVADLSRRELQVVLPRRPRRRVVTDEAYTRKANHERERSRGTASAEFHDRLGFIGEFDQEPELRDRGWRDEHRRVATGDRPQPGAYVEAPHCGRQIRKPPALCEQLMAHGPCEAQSREHEAGLELDHGIRIARHSCEAQHRPPFAHGATWRPAGGEQRIHRSHSCRTKRVGSRVIRHQPSLAVVLARIAGRCLALVGTGAGCA